MTAENDKLIWVERETYSKGHHYWCEKTYWIIAVDHDGQPIPNVEAGPYQQQTWRQLANDPGLTAELFEADTSWKWHSYSQQQLGAVDE